MIKVTGNKTNNKSGSKRESHKYADESRKG